MLNISTNEDGHLDRRLNRRRFFQNAGHRFGSLAFTTLLAEELSRERSNASFAAEEKAQSAAISKATARKSADELNPLTVHPPHYAARAKRVIFLFMEGGPSHVDLCDPKPELSRQNGKPLPTNFGKVVTPMGTGGNNLLASVRRFAKYGKCGMDFSDWLPHMATCADEFSLVRSCVADGLNHVGSVCQMNTGSILAGKPSLGSWAIYGLGSVNQNMPGFIVMTDGNEPLGGARNWGTGFMPQTFQGTRLLPGKNPILHLQTPRSVSENRQIQKRELIHQLNQFHQKQHRDDTFLSARQNAYELAFQMQAAAPDIINIHNESEKTKEAYGLNRKETADFGHRCLLARRLVERGVRFVQIYCGAGSQWDAHSNLQGNHTRMCTRADQPTAALIKDLKQRGLLADTLVIWGGEFGRTPMTEGKDGRDHNPYGFSMLFAGGGVKAGFTYGSTDEFGLRAVEGKAHVHDLHATILHLLGMNHEKLTYLYQGRDERLTDVYGNIVEDIVA